MTRSKREQREYVAHEFNVPQALPRITQRDVDAARISATDYVLKDLRQVVKALEAKALRAGDSEAYDFAIELVKSVISSHE